AGRSRPWRSRSRRGCRRSSREVRALDEFPRATLEKVSRADARRLAQRSWPVGAAAQAGEAGKLSPGSKTREDSLSCVRWTGGRLSGGEDLRSSLKGCFCP